MTKNFTLSEFNCKSGAPMPLEVRANIQRLANNLQVLRDWLGQPITINSGYRSPEYNKTIKGAASKSKHMEGIAADIVVKGRTPKQVYDEIERLISLGKMEQGGLKAYSSWVHYDCRLIKARW